MLVDELDDDDDGLDASRLKVLIGWPSLPNNGGGGLCSGKDIQSDSCTALKSKL